jgi:hypothetical protein
VVSYVFYIGVHVCYFLPPHGGYVVLGSLWTFFILLNILGICLCVATTHNRGNRKLDFFENYKKHMTFRHNIQNRDGSEKTM